MTAVQASDNTYHINGQHHFNGKAAYHSNVIQNGDRVLPAAFSKDVFSHLTLFTGNTMVTGTTGLLNSTTKKSNQELVSAIDHTLNWSLESAQVHGRAITIADNATLVPLEDDRSKYEITVKLFFLSPHGSSEPLSIDHLYNAIQDLETALSVASGNLKIDHFILAIPNQTFDENDLDSSEIDQFTEDVQKLYLPIWKRLSELRQAGRIGRLGVSEFSKQQLEILKAAAVHVGAVVPEINQVNLQDCCVLPKGLIEYAKAEGIELLTHGDSSDILPKSTLASLLQPHLAATSASLLEPNFVLKYSVLISSRGLISRKGYIVDAGSE
ncbi:hypothetical protein EC957_006185 [Mortierella hygrophila]|uniref:GCS light chain n=1 Tax=Mortierella hygrophila TaxID=979708 RepID=A0A9P6F075_9FUNG|nr:hypothetical protein EC957_006185 [Mortierella hygrophila]